MKNALTLITLLVTGPAVAMPVTWTLNDIVFDSGSTATGQFTYDVDTGLFYDIDITITLGDPNNYLTPDRIDGIATSHNYAAASSPYAFDALSIRRSYGGVEDIGILLLNNLYFKFESELTDSGGTVGLASTSFVEQQFRDLGDCYRLNSECVIYRENIVTGSVSAVPVPPALMLFGSALAALWYGRRDKTRS